MSITFSRRRALTVLAAAAGLPLLFKAGSARAQLLRWEGIAMGATASLQLYHTDEAKARAAITSALDELARLEKIFSLYRADSAISLLNRDGVLADAPAEFSELVSYARQLAEISDGVFDPTVQPVWRLYFHHFTTSRIDAAGPSQKDLDAALSLVDWRAIAVDANRVALLRPGMELTLNSVAQGYITDRVTEVLRAHGFKNMLVDMGEPRAAAAKPDGSAWRIGIANPADPNRSVATLEVVDQCVATSGGYGTVFDAEGRFTHIINSRTGRTAPALEGVSVVAKSALVADGLSTTLLMARPESRASLLRAGGGQEAIFVTPEGVTARVTA